ncbi:putative Cobalamin biosynthesis protein CbiD [Vibrio nigripulchritudo SO65]|nr:putative Cobalamin biosynthesis protein CbiD [Vibrio nigripulchritudo AM115]CCN44667.1 putative Cobalamin biosynthesis protein CbiD [Vibrio nigripulchritudo FTn2]CCN62949.1 putative Cobalamin biosynthesis protein CbiD [Vibrio nigripulchritudo POn4]CCN79636.1 putative Cobalamin biosynthesis protein CbiD [Vibrio nigripulchritudo SO65]
MSVLQATESKDLGRSKTRRVPQHRKSEYLNTHEYRAGLLKYLLLPCDLRGALCIQKKFASLDENTVVTKVKRSKNKSELRSGFTTGACAAAASRAAVQTLLTSHQPDYISITLPNGEPATFKVAFIHITKQTVTASVIKDAGDDPDCTHDAHIQCIARWQPTPGFTIEGGVGVARVTLPGLELPVGEAAINPVPRKNILDMVMLEWNQSTSSQRQAAGISLEICVPDGEERAKETIGPRLGLIGGISILGTRGTVKPYSTSAFSASVRQSVQIARQNGQNHLVLTTGSRTEKSAMTMLPDYPSMCFIQAGDFVGVGLRSSKRYQVDKVTVVAMIGKLGKMVAGHMMTHVSGKAIDFSLLADLAIQAGESSDFANQIRQANTGRHVLEIWKEAQSTRSAPNPLFLSVLCQQAAEHAAIYVKHAVSIEFKLIDFNGDLLAEHACPKGDIPKTPAPSNTHATQ